MTQPTRSQPLRVMHFICPTGFYGAEKWILSLVGNMDRRAITSELSVTREKGQPVLKLTDRFRALGLDTHEIRTGSRFDPRVIGRLTRLLRDRQVDVLHTHGYKADITGLAAARRAGVKIVSTTHGFENAKDLKLRFFIWLGCQSFRFFDRVVSLSEQLRSEVRRHGVRESCTQIITSGIDLTQMEPLILNREPGHYRSKDTLVIGFIGQMISRKNIHGLIKIFDEVAKHDQRLQLELVGDGGERDKFEQYAATLSTGDRINFRGFVDNPLVHLEKFDLFVMTSTMEGTPLCLMEAMAMGVPVVAYEIPGVDLLVKHRETGLLAKLGDHDSLSRYCTELINDPMLSHQLANAARQRILRHFSAKRMAGEYASLYRCLADKLPSPKATSH